MTVEDIKCCFKEATECVKEALDATRSQGGGQALVNPDSLILSLTNVFIQAKQQEEADRRVVPASQALGA